MFDDFEERNYRLTLANLPTTIRGFVYLESDGVPRIVLNANLTREMNWRTMRHELKHLAEGDLFNEDYHEYGDDSP